MKFARGRFIAFCDSDDVWISTKLEKQLSYMISNNYDFTHTNYKVISNHIHNIKYVYSFNKINFNLILRNNYIGCSTVIYDTTKIKNIYFPLFKKRHDWAMWISILKKIDYAYCYPEFLTLYRLHDSSLSKKKFSLIKYNYNIYRNFLGFNHFKSICYFISFLFFYFKFKLFSK